MSGDESLLNAAELLYQASNQTVAIPGNDWGLRYIGLQEEGAFSSWWGLDDPMFEQTSFGHRWKGEGNKTCLPWIPGTAVFNYWKMRDRFGTVDFAELRKRLHAVEANEVPCDIMHLDAHWQRFGCWSDMIWDRERFPDPEALISQIKALGFKISLRWTVMAGRFRTIAVSM